jgi:pimeloyl-ACP methyl ester carboxylesterase
MKSLCIVLLVLCAFAQEPEAHNASVNGMEMYYEISGSGPTLILLHGFTGSGRDWNAFRGKYAKGYRVIVPDLRGHGRSTNPSHHFTHRQSALDIYALLDQLGIRQFKAMGISTGGMTLIHMATQQPSRVEAMVLIGATIYFPEQARAVMRRSTVDTMTPQEWEDMRRTHKHGDEQIRDLRNEFHGFKDNYDDMNFTPPYLATITARTFIVQGDRDQFFPIAIPVEMYHAIPHSQLWIVPNGGHVPIEEHAEEFTRTALDFLRGEPVKR